MFYCRNDVLLTVAVIVVAAAVGVVVIGLIPSADSLNLLGCRCLDSKRDQSGRETQSYGYIQTDCCL